MKGIKLTENSPNGIFHPAKNERLIAKNGVPQKFSYKEAGLQGYGRLVYCG